MEQQQNECDAVAGGPLLQRWQKIRSELLPFGATLIAVSKAQPASAIDPLLAAGQRDFGENRVSEALQKWPAFKQRYPDTCLHLIGSLQTNKVKEALSLFDVIHTVDREALVDTLAKERSKTPGVCKAFFVQVNTGEEPQKGGVSPLHVPMLLEYCREKELPITGLMCVPPLGDVPAPHFALLRTLAQRAGIGQLSMGMSGDYGTALRLGATHVRIGTALFGEREKDFSA